MRKKEEDKEFEKIVYQIGYHINAWYLDEGKYQPTEEEAIKAGVNILRKRVILR